MGIDRWDVEPKKPYPRGCRTCGQFEIHIAVAVAESRPAGAEGWRDAYGLHVGLDHVPRQRRYGLGTDERSTR